MIPLRVLHAIGPDAGPATDGSRALVDWLARHGHASAALCVGEAPHLPAAVERLPWRQGLFASLSGARAQATRSVAEWTPDVIHVHDLRFLPPALDLARRLALSLVVGVTGTEDAGTARLLRDGRIGWVLLPTEGHRAHYLGKVGLPRDRVTYLPPGVDVAAAGSVPYRLGDGALVVGFTGPCDGSSGVPQLAHALAQLARSTPVRGLYRPSSPTDAARLRAALPPETGALIDIAPVERGDFMSRIDVFADAGTDDHVSVPLLEAMACARPVLALAVAGMPELVRDGHTAVLVRPGDADALAAGLRQLADPERRRQLGEAGRALARSRYDIGLIGEAMVELYRLAIGGTRNSSVKAEGSTVYRRISETRLAR